MQPDALLRKGGDRLEMKKNGAPQHHKLAYDDQQEHHLVCGRDWWHLRDTPSQLIVLLLSLSAGKAEIISCSFHLRHPLQRQAISSEGWAHSKETDYEWRCLNTSLWNQHCVRKVSFLKQEAGGRTGIPGTSIKMYNSIHLGLHFHGEYKVLFAAQRLVNFPAGLTSSNWGTWTACLLPSQNWPLEPSSCGLANFTVGRPEGSYCGQCLCWPAPLLDVAYRNSLFLSITPEREVPSPHNGWGNRSEKITHCPKVTPLTRGKGKTQTQYSELDQRFAN